MIYKIRVSIHIKLLKNNKVVYKTTQWIKARSIAWVEAKLTPELKGICRVTYNSELDYWNQFEFNTLKEFKDILAVDLEKDLVDTFK